MSVTNKECFKGPSLNLSLVKINRLHEKARRIVYEDYKSKFDGSRTIAPNPKTNPNPNPNPNQGQFSSGAIVWLPLNPKTNPNLDRN